MKFKEIAVGAQFGHAEGVQGYSSERIAGTKWPWEKMSPTTARYIGRPNPSMQQGEYKWLDQRSNLVTKP